jgi:hypothetical protein
MIQGVVKFHRGVMKMHTVLRMWLMLLMGLNMVVPLFFIGRLEAQVIFLTQVMSAALMMALTGKFGFTRILGAGHVLWIPLVYFLWTRLGENPANDFFGVWLRAVLVLNGISLVIDLVDVLRYARGEREETIQGL